MKRTRLIDPMAHTDRVAADALNVTNVARQAQALDRLGAYRDAAEPRYAVREVRGSTADGTALQSIVTALTEAGVITDATETVEDEITTGSIVADEISVERLTTQTTAKLRPRSTTDDNNTRPLLVEDYDASALVLVRSTQPGAVYPAAITIADQPYVLMRPVVIVANDNDASLNYVRLRSDGSVFATGQIRSTGEVKGATLSVSGAATFDGNVTLGNQTSDATTVNGVLKPAYRISAVDAPAVTSITKQAAAGSTGTTAGASGVTCTDIAGVVAITPNGTGITTGAQCRVYFANAKSSGTGYAVILTAGANAWGQQIYSGRAADYFTINFGVAGVANTAYNVHYLIVDLA